MEEVALCVLRSMVSSHLPPGFCELTDAKGTGKRFRLRLLLQAAGSVGTCHAEGTWACSVHRGFASLAGTWLCLTDDLA